MAAMHVGISGWRYDGWRGDFYPSTLPHRRQLEYASAALRAIEINGTFYSLQAPESFRSWREEAVPGTVFAVKGSRYITHMLRLKNVDAALANFFANGLLCLEEQLGPVLWQLPPRMKWEPDVLARFCDMLPVDTRRAAALGKKHDARVKGRTALHVDRTRPLRHAFEIRDERMFHAEAFEILRAHGHALVFADTAQKFPYAEDLTSDFAYVRLHGAEELYASGYDEASLRRWARRIRRWHRGRSQPRDVYVFFDNDAKVHAPFDALELSRILGLKRDPGKLRGNDGEPLPAPPRLQPATSPAYKARGVPGGARSQNG
jgi:uncharacterized protein YecE (DUF72 family)